MPDVQGSCGADVCLRHLARAGGASIASRGSSTGVTEEKEDQQTGAQPEERGLTDATGQARWRIPIPDSVWDELRRPDAETDATWDGQRFRSVYGVPKKIFDELVEEVVGSMASCAARRRLVMESRALSQSHWSSRWQQSWRCASPGKSSRLLRDFTRSAHRTAG